jgi:uncharacterized membrane-anchored protein
MNDITAHQLRVNPGDTAAVAGRKLLNKVPEITLCFWVIKILCTTVGETAADLLNENLGLGLTVTSYLMAVLLVAISWTTWACHYRRPRSGSVWRSQPCSRVGT